MASNTFVEINLAEAADLADLAGAQFDLNSARLLSHALKDNFEAPDPNYSLVDPYSTAILVRYSRPFVTGVRKRLGEEVLSVLTKAQRKKHDRLRAFRDKHIAHSVNAFEDNQLVGRYWVERVAEEGITSVEVNQTRIIGLSSSDIEDIIELTTAMLAHLDTKLREEKVRILQIVRKMPIDKVIGRSRKPIKRMDMAKIHKARKRA
jgi:hypothetical protein